MYMYIIHIVHVVFVHMHIDNIIILTMHYYNSILKIQYIYISHIIAECRYLFTTMAVRKGR